MQLTHMHDLGIHNEMIGDGILTLVESGAVTNRRKNYLPGKMVATFALGSGKLYRLMDRNPALEIHPVDFTNDTALAGQNDKLIAINATLQIDLLGQCGSESLGFSPYSGTSGQSDFARAPPTDRAAERPLLFYPQPPKTTAFHASCRCSVPAPTSARARTISTTSSPNTAWPSCAANRPGSARVDPDCPSGFPGGTDGAG